jgi:ketosteroid isomerase-like protein
VKTKMLIVLTASLLIGAGAGQDGAAVKEVEQAIRTLNEAFVKKDADTIRRLMADEHLAITAYYGGAQTKAEQLKNLPDYQVTEYTSGKTTVTLLSKDVALVSYPLTQKGTLKGKPLSQKNYAAAVWVNRDGKWLEASYQETPLGGQ